MLRNMFFTSHAPFSEIFIQISTRNDGEEKAFWWWHESQLWKAFFLHTLLLMKMFNKAQKRGEN